MDAENTHRKTKLTRITKPTLDVISIIIAAVAVLLSQFPPVHTWWDKAEFEIKDVNELFVQASSTKGTAVGKQVALTNVGQEIGRIFDIELIVTSKDFDIIQRLKAKRYKEPSANFREAWVTYTELAIEKGEHWSKFVVFEGEISPTNFSQTQELSKIEAKERSLWEDEMRSLGVDLSFGNRSKPTYSMSESLFEKVKTHIQGMLKFIKSGEYKLVQALYTDEGIIMTVYRFDITSEHISIFDRSLWAFKYFFQPFEVEPMILNLEYSKEKPPARIEELLQSTYLANQ
jgi:hypothetical protein